MLTLDRIHSTFRHLDSRDYTELVALTPEQIYDAKMGPGALYLAVRMARTLDLRPDQVVLDVGCGRGVTSVFLAGHYGATVVAVDLWNPADVIAARAHAAGLAHRVLPLRLDIAAPLPFAEAYFDAIFCMDAIHYFGANPGFFPHLLKHLKPGGRLTLGSPCFSAEFTAAQLASLPHEYDDGTRLWPDEFSRYHSPRWWADLIASTGMTTLHTCQELPDGVVMWEDDALYNIAHGQNEKITLTDAAQIVFGRDHPDWARLTHFVVTVVKKPSGASDDS